MEPTRVLIVDDHHVVRRGLRAILEAESDIEVVGEASDGAEALAKAQELAPTLVLMDTRMPGMDGFECTRRLKSNAPATSVVILSLYDNDAYIMEALHAGAVGYITKDAPRELLVETVRAVSAGLILMSPTLLRRTIDWLALPKREEKETGSPSKGGALTSREQSVLDLMAEGFTNRQIAARLRVAQDTVKKQVQVLIAKFQATDRTEAAVKAVRSGMTSGRGTEARLRGPVGHFVPQQGV